jgi:hypothetical protein
MSETFKRLHDHFRALKEQHGIDLTVPHGVEIDGKVYPGTHKRITLGTNYGSTDPFYEADFKINLENGLKVAASTMDDNLHLQLHVPTIHLNDDGNKWYRYGPAYNLGEDAYNASLGKNKTNENVSLHDTRGPISVAHDVIKMWGEEPYQGTYDWHNKEGYQHFKNLRPDYNDEVDFYQDLRGLTQDELTEHRKNDKLRPEHAPHNVTVYGIDTLPAFHNYNTKTEQLRPVEEVFPTFRRD